MGVDVGDWYTDDELREVTHSGEKMGGTRVSDGCAWAPKIAV